MYPGPCARMPDGTCDTSRTPFSRSSPGAAAVAARGRSCARSGLQELAVPFVRGVVALDEFANVDATLPRSWRESAPGDVGLRRRVHLHDSSWCLRSVCRWLQPDVRSVRLQPDDQRCAYARRDEPRVPGDHQLFVGREDPGRDTARSGADARSAAAIRLGIHVNAEPRGIAAHTLPNRCAVLSDAGGEDQRVKPPSAAASEPSSRRMR